MSLKEFHQEVDDFVSFIRPISFPAKVIWDTASPHPLPLSISPPAEKVSFLQLFRCPCTGPCLHLVNKVGKGPGSSSRAPSVPNALNGHDTTLNFRFSATAGETSAGRDSGPVTVPSAVAISLPVIRHYLEPAVLRCQSSVDLWNGPVQSRASLQALGVPALKQLASLAHLGREGWPRPYGLSMLSAHNSVGLIKPTARAENPEG